MAAKTNASFIEPMLLLRTEGLAEGEEWLYQLKYDGYRAVAFKSGGKVQLRLRNDNVSSRSAAVALHFQSSVSGDLKLRSIFEIFV